MSEENQIIEEEKKIKDEEESEDEQDIQDIKKLKEKKLCKIVVNKDSLQGIKFNLKKCVEDNLLKETEDIQLYTNLYPIKFTKPIQICEYPFIIKPECHEESVILKILRESISLPF